VTFLVEVVLIEEWMDGNFLRTTHTPEPQYGAFSSSKWEVRTLYPVILPTADLLSIGIANNFHRRAMGAQSIGHNHF